MLLHYCLPVYNTDESFSYRKQIYYQFINSSFNTYVYNIAETNILKLACLRQGLDTLYNTVIINGIFVVVVVVVVLNRTLRKHFYLT